MYEFKNWQQIVEEKDAEIQRLKESIEQVHEDVSQAISDYCINLVEQGKDSVEVTEFNAEIQRWLQKRGSDNGRT